MSRRPPSVTDSDVALLRALSRERSVVAASQSLGMTRDRAVYRLRRLERAFGRPVVDSERGGRSHGATYLTELGDRLVHRGFDTVELAMTAPLRTSPRVNRLRGVYAAGPPPSVVSAGGLRWRVTFGGDDGERVTMLLDPESIVLARRAFPSSARNVVTGVVERVHRGDFADARVTVRVGAGRVSVAVTPESVRQLGLRPGAHIVLLVKATSLRRVGDPDARAIRGSLRS